MPQPIQKQQSGLQQQQQDPMQAFLGTVGQAGLAAGLNALFPGSGAAAGGLMGLFSSLFGGGQEQPAQSAAVQTPGDGGQAGAAAGGAVGSEQLKVPEEKKQEETKVEPVKTEVPQGLASTASLSPEQKVPVMTGDAPAAGAGAAPGGEGQAAGGSLIPQQDPYQDPLILAALSQARQEGGWM